MLSINRVSVGVSGLCSARRPWWSLAKASGDSPGRNINVPARPWRTAFIETVPLPSADLGPVLCWQLAWFAATCAGLDIQTLLEIEKAPTARRQRRGLIQRPG